MNIGFIEDTHLRGGTQIWVTEANRYFLQKGEDTTVLAPSGSWVADECGKDGATVVTYDYDAVVTQDAKNREIWSEGLEKCGVAVCTVHPPRQDFHCAVFAAECIKEGELDAILMPKTGTIVPEYKREFYVPDASIRSTVIAITDFTRKYLIDTYKIPEDMIELIYQGTEVDRYSPNAGRKQESFERYPLPNKAAPILGSVGVFEERKGQIVLLEAIKKLAGGKFANIHLILVGEGPDEQMLKETTAKMGLEKNVTFFPFTREPEYVFERIDILALSSLRKEGLPNVLLEAMSMGVPVVSSKLAGVPEIVKNGETGFMVEPGDPGLLAEAIEKLWRDNVAYQKMAGTARQLMLKQFDKKLQFDAFLKYFYNAL